MERRKLLIVDDERMVVRAIGRLLAREYEIIMAFSAQEALERLTAGERFDAILSDLSMPEVDGMQFFAQVATLDPAQSHRFIFLTGYVTPRLRRFLDTNQRPPQVLEKPFSPERLKELIHVAGLPAPAL